MTDSRLDAPKDKPVYFYFPGSRAYDSETVRSLPCGGTEKAVIFLAEALKRKGYETHVLQDFDELEQVAPDSVLIAQEAAVFMETMAAKKIWWLHHFSDQPVTKRAAAFARIAADRVVTLSQAQQIDLADVMRIGSTVIGHGVDCEIHAPWSFRGYRFIYASTPFRGLEKLPTIWRKIQPVLQGARLEICSSMGTYGTPEEDAKYQAIFDELASLPGVTLHGALNQPDLFALMRECSFFIYPCTWPETYCMVMDEAKANGCLPLVSNLGALPERVYKAFELDSFASDVLAAMNSNTIWTHKPRTWDEVASDWVKVIE